MENWPRRKTKLQVQEIRNPPLDWQYFKKCNQTPPLRMIYEIKQHFKEKKKKKKKGNVLTAITGAHKLATVKALWLSGREKHFK